MTSDDRELSERYARALGWVALVDFCPTYRRLRVDRGWGAECDDPGDRHSWLSPKGQADHARGDYIDDQWEPAPHFSEPEMVVAGLEWLLSHGWLIEAYKEETTGFVSIELAHSTLHEQAEYADTWQRALAHIVVAAHEAEGNDEAVS